MTDALKKLGENRYKMFQRLQAVAREDGFVVKLSDDGHCFVFYRTDGTEAKRVSVDVYPA